MRLYHVTRRENCPGIAAEGLKDGQYLPKGVWLADGLWCHEDATAYLPDQHEELTDDGVVLAFDIPDDIAAEWTETWEPPLPPDYDPEIDKPDEDYEKYIVGRSQTLACLPAELVNRHFAGVIHWKGDPPFTDAELA